MAELPPVWWTWFSGVACLTVWRSSVHAERAGLGLVSELQRATADSQCCPFRRIVFARFPRSHRPNRSLDDRSFDRGPQRRGPIGHDLDRFTMGSECPGEEPSCCSEIASRGDEHVDDLTELINCPVDVTPRARDLHIGLVDIPTVIDRMAARAGSIREQRRETCTHR